MLKRFNKIRCNFFATLEKITYRKKKLAPPAGLKTTTMLKMASLQLGLSPFEASKEAQKLYMNGLISYPRTKSTKYSENFDFKRSLNMFTENPHFSEKVNELLDDFDMNNVDFSRGEEKGGHEPIIPTYSTTQENIRNDLNWELYRCICLYYFASLSPPMEYENISSVSSSWASRRGSARSTNSSSFSKQRTTWTRASVCRTVCSSALPLPLPGLMPAMSTKSMEAGEYFFG